jgi:hypothetical protein
VTAGLTGEEFVGYTFGGSPPRRPRLWFLDRHVALLLSAGWIGDIDIGTWTADLYYVDNQLNPVGNLRYEHHGIEPWTAVWRLTNVTIPHIHTFGRDDDVWRLGMWPD